MARHEIVNFLLFAMSAHIKISRLGSAASAIEGIAYNVFSILLANDFELPINMQLGKSAAAKNRSFVGVLMVANVAVNGRI